WGPVLEVSSTPRAARDAAGREGTDWVGLLSDGMIRGWAPVSELEGVSSLEELAARPFSAPIRRNSTLRQALDAMVGARFASAVVAEDGFYCGLVDMKTVWEALGSSDE
ncbi:MAG: hypothetical protein OXN80_00290, partial [bacterium]|nr:hypothetical protein [bacterium]